MSFDPLPCIIKETYQGQRRILWNIGRSKLGQDDLQAIDRLTEGDLGAAPGQPVRTLTDQTRPRTEKRRKRMHEILKTARVGISCTGRWSPNC